ncbi:MAG: cation transporter [Gammaproteobacteria bacterium]|nr:cation transporter [Gammaproteobacteria bacterium]
MSDVSQVESQQVEARALRRSAWLYLFMALLGGGFAYLSESEAILLDGVYSFISLLMTFVAQRVSRLVQTPYTDQFHFGFAHFEPILNVIRILLILAVAMFAAISAVMALLNGGRPLNADAAVFYGVLAATGCLIMAWVQGRASKRAGSPILAVDARNWLVDGVLSSGVAVTFLVAFFMKDSAYAHWVPFIDPLLVITMIMLLLPVPLKTFGDNLKEVLLTAPEPELQLKIRGLVEQAYDPGEDGRIFVRMLPVGRFMYLQVHVLLSPDSPNTAITEYDGVRQRIHEAVKGVHPRLSLDVIFTADERWLWIDSMSN